jgi:4-amino-4-deoxy-L-arabinose transferase-like glycosyltransferase
MIAFLRKYHYLLIILFALGAASALALTHPLSALVSFDEGFHGGAVVFVQQMVHYVFHNLPYRPTPLIGEFTNGLTLYPPTWTIVASFLALIFGPTAEVIRFGTSIFYIAIIVFTYWFVLKAIGRKMAAAAAAIATGTVPLIMIYSNLMMLEVPLVLGITAAIACWYLYTEGIIQRNWKNALWICLVFGFGTLTKMAAIYVIWGVVVGYSILDSLLFYKKKAYKKYLKPELLLFLLSSAAALLIFVALEKRYLGASMIEYFLNQSKSIRESQGGDAHVGFLTQALGGMWERREFYLRDLYHMPYLATIWFASLGIYVVWKRNSFAVLLAVWAFVAYAAFSAVYPQVVQYNMPFYVPTGIATGLMIFELGQLLKKHIKYPLAFSAALLTLLVIGQTAAMAESETYAWRNARNEEIQASQQLAAGALKGDRVATWNDGVTFSVRSEGLAKQLQLRNGVQQICPDALVDSFEWVLLTNGDPYPSTIDKEVLGKAPWKEVGRFGEDNSTVLYHNTRGSKNVTIEGETYGTAPVVADAQASGGKALELSKVVSQPSLWGCYRMLTLGSVSANFFIKGVNLPNLDPATPVLKLEYTGYPSGENVEKILTLKDVSGDAYKAFNLTIDHKKINLPGEFRAYALQEGAYRLDKIEITAP